MARNKVKFGVRLIDDLGGPRELIGLAQLAERLGYDSVLFPHDIAKGVVAKPFVRIPGEYELA